MHLSREEYARKRIHNGYLVQIQISVTRVTVWHHSARLVMPNSYPRDGIFNQNITTIKDSYSCTPACCCFFLFCFLFFLFFFFFFFFRFVFYLFCFFGGWGGVCFLLLFFFFIIIIICFVCVFCCCFLFFVFFVFLFVCFFFCFFSSLPEPKAHWWAYRICRPPSSVVRRPSVCLSSVVHTL